MLGVPFRQTRRVGPTGIPPYVLGLVRLRNDGTIAWSRQYQGSYGLTWISVAVSGMGNTFLSFHTDCVVGMSCMDFGAGQATGNVLVRFDPAGRVVWQWAIAATYGLSQVTVAGNGGVAVAVYRDDRRLVRYRWDGTLIYDVAAPDVGGPVGPYPLAIGWNLAGDRLWTRPLGATGWAVSIDPVSHHVRAGGALLGTVDFGTGPVTSRGDLDGWVLDVLP